MKFCKRCGKKMSSNSKFCPNCGFDQSQSINSNYRTSGNRYYNSHKSHLDTGAKIGLSYNIDSSGINDSLYFIRNYSTTISTIISAIFLAKSCEMLY